jgi:hypothetical protein
VGRLFQLSAQPGSGHGPIALNRFFGDGQCLGSFLHDLGLARVNRGQFLEEASIVRYSSILPASIQPERSKSTGSPESRF